MSVQPGAKFRIGVTNGIRGWFAVLYEVESCEPVQTGIGSYDTREGAVREAIDWAIEEGVPCDESPK